jgi:hypothetical protein
MYMSSAPLFLYLVRDHSRIIGDAGRNFVVLTISLWDAPCVPRSDPVIGLKQAPDTARKSPSYVGFAYGVFEY